MNDIEELKEKIKAIKNFSKEDLKRFQKYNSSIYTLISSIMDFFIKEDIEDICLIFNDDIRRIEEFEESFISSSNKELDGNPQQNFIQNAQKLLQIIEKSKSDEREINSSIKKFEEATSKISNAYKESKVLLDDLENAKKAIKEDNKFKASTEYWSNKKDKHNKIILGILVGIIIIFLILFYLIGDSCISLDNRHNELNQTQILNNDDSNQTKTHNDELNSATDLKYFDYLKYMTLISIFIWLLRLILKVLFSNLHLAEEAYEKETMISTYLALIKDGAMLGDKEKSLILEAIFRPSSNGLIKDESNVTLLDALKAFKN